jgi:hypothetical protein
VLFNHLYRFANKDRQLAGPKVNIGFYSGKREADFVIGEYGFEVKLRNEVTSYDFTDVGIKNKILLSKKTVGKESRQNRVKILLLFMLLAVL